MSKVIGKQDYNCAYAYWDDDDYDEDGSCHVSGPYCGCEKEKARYGCYGAAACGGVGTCKYWRLRDHGDCAVLGATEEEYEEGRRRWEAERRAIDHAVKGCEVEPDLSALEDEDDEDECRAANAEEASVKDAHESWEEWDHTSMTPLDYAVVEEFFSGNKDPKAMLCHDGKLRVMSGAWLLNPPLDASEDDLEQLKAHVCPTCGFDKHSGCCTNLLCKAYLVTPKLQRTPQRCPVCDGTGLVSRPPGIAGDQPTWEGTTAGPYKCNGCAGTGIVWG